MRGQIAHADPDAQGNANDGAGHLKGYAWGLHRKRWLLEHEKAIGPHPLTPQTATLPGF